MSVYVELPAGMVLEGKNNSSSAYVLKLNKSLYGLKQGRLNWHKKLKEALLVRVFTESISDPCVFLSKDLIILVYVDDCILISKDDIAIPNFIKSLESGSENFIFTGERSLSSCLGVSMNRLPDGSGFAMSQPFLLDRIIKAVCFDSATIKSARDGVGTSSVSFAQQGLQWSATQGELEVQEC